MNEWEQFREAWVQAAGVPVIPSAAEYEAMTAEQQEQWMADMAKQAAQVLERMPHV